MDVITGNSSVCEVFDDTQRSENVDIQRSEKPIDKPCNEEYSKSQKNTRKKEADQKNEYGEQNMDLCRPCGNDKNE